MRDFSMISNSHIVYDLDDVLADFWGTALPIMNKKFGTNLVKENFTDYNSFVDQLGIGKDQFLDFVRDCVPMHSLEVNKPYQELINRQYADNEITIITSRDYIPGAKELTEYWLKQNNIQYNNLHISGMVKKSEFVDSIDLVYDDHHANIDDYFDSGKLLGYAIIVDQPWNRHYRRDKVIRKHTTSYG